MLYTSREKVLQAFKEGKLWVKSVSPEGVPEWKQVLAVHRAEVGPETIWEGSTGEGPFVLTGGHRVFLNPLEKTETENLSVGDLLLGVDKQGCVYRPQVRNLQKVEGRRYMYDLTAADWHNFVLHRSRVVISNSPDRNYRFRPPEHESTIGNYNRVFGYVWEDAELQQYLARAVDWFDMFPPRTSLRTVDRLYSEAPDWRTAMYYGAMMFALMALAINWVHDEFSLDYRTLVRVRLPDGRDVEVPLGELWEICHGPF